MRLGDTFDQRPSDSALNVVPATERKATMYAVFRTYSGQGASELFDLLEQREEDVTALISGVPGFVTYAAVRRADGGATVAVCGDKAGTDETSRGAAPGGPENRSGAAG